MTDAESGAAAPPPATTRGDRLWRVVTVVLVVGAIVFIVQGANRPRDPHLAPAGTAAPPPRTPVAGFGEVAFRVDKRPGVDRCALTADTVQQQEQGLMGRTDLAGYDAMLFRFHGLTNAQFYMKDTLIPLSIAWFDAAGRFVSSADMTPCPPPGVNCPLFAASAPYETAIEVPEGGLGRLGIGAGAHLVIGGACH